MLFYLTTGPHVWSQFFFPILPKFYHFRFVTRSFLLRFCFVFFYLITDFELELYGIFGP